MRRVVLLAMAFVVLPAAFSWAKDERPQSQEEKREVLSSHETLAVFDGIEFRLCRGLTSLCPARCGHSGEFASFSIKKYLKYEKPGEYGDPEQQTFLVQVSDRDKKAKGDPKILETVRALKPGDYVLLSWSHEYVTQGGSSFPERPIVKLAPIDKEKAEKLLLAGAAETPKQPPQR
jgi:hypothetical protein